MILYDFHMILCDFYMILGGVAEIFGWTVFLNLKVLPDFERSTGNSKYHSWMGKIRKEPRQDSREILEERTLEKNGTLEKFRGARQFRKTLIFEKTGISEKFGCTGEFRTNMEIKKNGIDEKFCHNSESYYGTFGVILQDIRGHITEHSKSHRIIPRSYKIISKSCKIISDPDRGTPRSL